MAKRNKFNGGNGIQSAAARSLDDLAEFEEFQADILPQLRAAIKDGRSAEDIYKMVASAAAGKLATLAIKEADPMKSLALIKEVLDRSGGKATERKEIKTTIEAMADEELEASIASLMDEEADASPESKH